MNKLANSLALLAATASAGVADYPGDYCCRIFKEDNFGGEFADFCLKDIEFTTEQWWLMDVYGFENSMNSYICGAKVAYDFCDDGVGSDCGNLHGSWGAGTEWNPSIGNEANKMSLLRLRTYDASDNGAVVVYNNPDCAGMHGRFYGSKDSSYDATFVYSEWKASNGRNDSVSSVRVPFGYTAYLYGKDGFQGNVWTVEGELSTDPNMPALCVNAPANLDDIATSLKIARTDSIAPAYGHWVGFTGTESVTFQLHQGFTSTNEHETDVT